MATSQAPRRQFPSAPQSMALVRRFVEEQAKGHPCLDSAVLVADEMATNAFQHTLSPEFSVSVHVEDEMLTVLVGAVAVTTTAPHVCGDGREGRADGERGRGLFLVEALSEEWGVYALGQQQIVYAIVTPAQGALAEALP